PGLAGPATAAAITRASRASSRQPTIAVEDARGCTRTWTSSGSVLGTRFADLEVRLAGEKPLVLLDGGPQLLEEMAMRPLQALDVGPDPRLLGPGCLHHLLALQLGFAHHELAFAPGPVLHLLRPLLGRASRV